jgi:hypothetical protein
MTSSYLSGPPYEVEPSAKFEKNNHHDAKVSLAEDGYSGLILIFPPLQAAESFFKHAIQTVADGSGYNWHVSNDLGTLVSLHGKETANGADPGNLELFISAAQGILDYAGIITNFEELSSDNQL